MTERYRHTQRGKIHLILLGVALLMVAASLRTNPEAPWVSVLLVAVGAIFVVLAAAFAQLSVVEADDHVRIAFGPLPLASRRLAFADVRDARPGRSALIDGWGVHRIPGRGWTWNLWGMGCVEVDLADGGTLRIGTDDSERLAALLVERAAEHKATS